MPTLSPSPVRVLHVPQRNSIAPTATASAPEVDSDRLLQGQREILIRHGNECYRLRHTRNDKLILTK
ncbi:hemin uptake protein HemP [Luteimonas galliterrae]|uniref:hemin uptake protein HemP n=1 Tax=Luteimonas galliterrae TaxID=2940486 RepID=UPI003CE4FB43